MQREGKEEDGGAVCPSPWQTELFWGMLEKGRRRKHPFEREPWKRGGEDDSKQSSERACINNYYRSFGDASGKRWEGKKKESRRERYIK